MGDQASSPPGYSHARNNNQDGYRGLSNSNKQALYQGANVLGSANDPDSNAKSAPGILERVHATLDTIQDNVSRFEKGIHTPAAFKLGFSANGIVFWVAIEEPQLLHAAAGQINTQQSDVGRARRRAGGGGGGAAGGGGGGGGGGRRGARGSGRGGGSAASSGRTRRDRREREGRT